MRPRTSAMILSVVVVTALLLASTLPAAGPESRPDGTDGPSKRTTAPATKSEPGSIHFRAVQIYVDTGDKPLAAYQFDLTATAGDVTLVGLEGGDHPAFKPAPYYDTLALLNNKVIVAAFSTAADLPRGRSRVATLMVQVTGDVEPAYSGKLTAAASADGNPIQAELIVTPLPEGAHP